MVKNRRLIFKLIILGLLLGLFTLGYNNPVSAEEQSIEEIGFQFYRTTEEDLAINEENVLTGFSDAFLERVESNVTLVIPDTIQTISANAFLGRMEIVTVELPMVLPEIEADAFLKCDRIVEVYDTSGTVIDPQMASLQYGGLFYNALSFRGKDMESNITIEADGQVFCKANRGIMLNQNFFVGYLGTYPNLVLAEKDFDYEIYAYALWKNDIVVSVNAGLSNAKTIGEYAFYSCNNLKFVTLPDNLQEIGFAAFQNSSQLLSVEILEEKSLPKALQRIGAYAFDHTSLGGRVYIPKSVENIGESAFLNCNIEELIFEDVLEKTDINLTIEQNAFRNCTRLAIVELPKRLKKIHSYAFYGSSLSTIYIHASNVEYCDDSTDLESNAYFPYTATIIYDTKDAYLLARQEANLQTHTSQMTYSITIRFSDDIHTIEMQRLANRDFDFVKGNDGIWSKVSYDLRMALLPTQKDYVFSVWHCTEVYLGQNEFSTKDEQSVDDAIELISYMLQNALRDGITQLEFYANRVEKPVVQGKSLSYNESESYNNSESWASLIENIEGQPGFDFSYMNISLGDDKINISDAGDYTLVIQLREEYGAWLQEVYVPITIERKMIYLNNMISWSADIEGNLFNLLSGSVYVYRNAFGDSQYAYSPLKPEQIKKGFSFYSVKSVTNSIIRARNSLVSVTLDENAYFDIFYSGENFKFEGVEEALGQNQGLDNNVYAAKAIIKVKPNYSFRSLGDVDSITNSSKGLTIDISDDRTEARITKIWYILDVSNSIFNKDTKEEFNITGWKYNTNAYLNLPELEHANPTDVLTYSLVKDATPLVEEALVEDEHSGLFYYLNSSMPAGNYTLTLHVPDVELNGLLYFGYNISYSFIVDPADFKEEWREDASLKLLDTEWQYSESNGEGIVQVYHHASYNDAHQESLNDHSVQLKIWSDFENIGLNPDRQGYWASKDADVYYSSRFVLTYNLDRMQQNKYFTYEELQNSSSAFSPKQIDDYKVYYQLKAKNYSPLVNEAEDSERRKYYFEVTIFDCIPIPKVSSMEYTGLELKPTLDTSLHFTVSYEDDEYISAGKHSLTLYSLDPRHYRWNKNSLDDKINIEFEITETKNYWLQSPSILSWEYGSFIAENRLIIAEPKYGNEIAFAIASDEKGEHKLLGLEKFYIKDGVVQEEAIISLLKTLPASLDSEFYYLISMVEGTQNYTSLQESTRFQVFKTKNTWKTTPNVMQWKFGNYDKAINLIIAEASLKDEKNPVTFMITYDMEGKNPVEGLESFTTENGIVSEEHAEILSRLGVRTYYLFAKVAETQSYAGLNPEPYEFKISIATNYWDNVPTISSWVEGKYNVELNSILAKSHFGDEVRIVITLAGQKDKVIYDSQNGIDELSKAKSGVYELSAYVAETEDYSELSYSMAFQIFEKPGIPWWGVTLIVIGSLALVALVFFILHQSGILQVLSGKFIIAMRTKATIDATIVAVRANKIAEESQRTIAAAKQKEITELRKSSKLSERSSIKDERAKLSNDRAEKYQKRADQMQIKAERMIQKANKKGKLKFDDRNQK